MHDNIEHPGIINKIENDRVWVSIQPQSACGSCHSKSLCGMAEVAEKVVEVKSPGPNHTFNPGQSVVINLKKSSGYRALFLGYLLPFLIVMATLIISLQITHNEGFSALLALFTVVPYYGILYLRREVIKTSFRFYIKP